MNRTEFNDFGWARHTISAQISNYLSVYIMEFYMDLIEDGHIRGEVLLSRKISEMIEQDIIREKLDNIAKGLAYIVHNGHSLNTINDMISQDRSPKGSVCPYIKVRWLEIGDFEVHYIEKKFHEIKFKLDDRVFSMIRSQSLVNVNKSIINIRNRNILADNKILNSRTIENLLFHALLEKKGVMYIPFDKNDPFVEVRDMTMLIDSSLVTRLAILWAGGIALNLTDCYVYLLLYCFIMKKTISIDAFGTFIWDGFDYNFTADDNLIRYLKSNLRGQKQLIPEYQYHEV